ncbi:VOC family protein [Capnocytophaga granulosa]|uniref:VOC family protein n=1 Tax=Capnocytophaga granulosa TaxID=45242 RepID=UPI0028E3E4B2|nr:VOC family protein [Capnocytophaga granulosa]
MSISYNSITTCVGNVQVSEENTSENGSVYKVSGETDAIGKDIPFSCSYIKPTEEIAPIKQQLQTNNIPIENDYDIPVGEYLYIRDPNGYRICIYELFVP